MSTCDTAACDLLRRSCPNFLRNCRSLPSCMRAPSHSSHASQVVNASDWDRRHGGSSVSNTGTGTRITLAFFRLRSMVSPPSNRIAHFLFSVCSASIRSSCCFRKRIISAASTFLFFVAIASDCFVFFLFLCRFPWSPRAHPSSAPHQC